LVGSDWGVWGDWLVGSDRKNRLVGCEWSFRRDWGFRLDGFVGSDGFDRTDW
jgi:hypothetical protein